MAGKSQLDKPTKTLEELALEANSIQQSPANAPLSVEELQDKGYLRDLAMRELVAIVRANGGDIKGVAAVRELLDRVDGKAAQSITLDGEIRKVTVNCHIRFTDELPSPVDNLIIDHVDNSQAIDSK